MPRQGSFISKVIVPTHAHAQTAMYMSGKVVGNNNGPNVNMLVVLSSWPLSHCESSVGSFDDCRLIAGWPPTLRPIQSTWSARPPVYCYRPHPPLPFITFRVSPRRREMYCGHARLCVCLSAAACLHFCTDPDVTCASGRGCSLVVHNWADL